MNLVIGLIMIFLRNATINAINKIWKQLIMAKLTINPPTISHHESRVRHIRINLLDNQVFRSLALILVGTLAQHRPLCAYSRKPVRAAVQTLSVYISQHA